MPFIVKASSEDSADIMNLINQCKTRMESESIYQWDSHYPTLDMIRGDIDNNSMHILKQGDSILGIIVIDEDQRPEYNGLAWICNSGKSLVIHRLAVQPKSQGCGIGKILVAFAEDHAKEQKYASIRLDAYSGNPAAVKLYEHRGYIKVGQITLPRRMLPFNCYEKIL